MPYVSGQRTCASVCNPIAVLASSSEAHVSTLMSLPDDQVISPIFRLVISSGGSPVNSLGVGTLCIVSSDYLYWK